MTKKSITIEYEFVEYIPNHLENGKVYISIPFTTATHKCCCGCGKEVVTPFSPTDWKLIFDGQSISLDPSIGNWSFACKSHYWIRDNKVVWASSWSRGEVEAGRAHDRMRKDSFFDQEKSKPQFEDDSQKANKSSTEKGFWSTLKKFWPF